MLIEDKATPVIGPVVSSDRMTSRKGPRNMLESKSLKSKEKRNNSKIWVKMFVKKINLRLLKIVLYSIVYTVYFKYCKVLVVATGRIREEYKQELTLPSPMCISQNWKEN